MAGFKPDEMGNYDLPRVKMSTSRRSPPDPTDLTEHLVGEGPSDQDDMAAQGFLRLLDQPRTILLQDSVLLRREFSGHLARALPEAGLPGIRRPAGASPVGQHDA